MNDINEGPLNHRVQVRLSAAERKQVQDIAVELNLSLSDATRELMAFAASQPEEFKRHVRRER